MHASTVILVAFLTSVLTTTGAVFVIDGGEVSKL